MLATLRQTILAGQKLRPNPCRIGIGNRKSSSKNLALDNKKLQVLGKDFDVDQWTNITPKIISLLDRKLHLQKHHPLWILKQKIVNHFYKFKSYRGNPIFSVHDQLNPIVTVYQNYDSLLVNITNYFKLLTDFYEFCPRFPKIIRVEKNQIRITSTLSIFYEPTPPLIRPS